MENPNDISGPTLADASPLAKQIYSVPRRYDLATLFAISAAYAILFGVLRSTQLPPSAFVLVAGFVTFVGASQAVLFRGQRPREASILAGGVYWSAALITANVLADPADPFRYDVGLGLLCGTSVGAACGYLAGTLVAGIFLVADLVRQAAKYCVRSKRV